MREIEMRRNRKTILLAPLLAALALAAAEDTPALRRLREAMVRDTIAQPTDGRDPVRDPRVLEAMLKTPRHEFVPAGFLSRAYDDRPLPIGHSQTISQPYIVAKMTELLKPEPGQRVLEIGTGSGYQAAVLAPLVQDVYTIEIVEPLGLEARQRLERLGYSNVHVRVGDGYFGWPEAAPFDSIIATAWATHIPPPLLEQLKPGGRIVIPIGQELYDQQLAVVHKGETSADLRIESVMPVIFVPLTGDHSKPPR